MMTRGGKNLKPHTSYGGCSELALSIHSKIHSVLSNTAGAKQRKPHFPHLPAVGFCLCQLEAHGRRISGWSHLLCFCWQTQSEHTGLFCSIISLG